jgi:hypothetical protein
MRHVTREYLQRAEERLMRARSPVLNVALYLQHERLGEESVAGSISLAEGVQVFEIQEVRQGVFSF